MRAGIIPLNRMLIDLSLPNFDLELILFCFCLFVFLFVFFFFLSGMIVFVGFV